ncbi:Os06g0614400 [Oryza sativa Japonica Group]|uniref:Os06g0614400 protein n=2 Tax=Oryza sativa subsp. japonica TaxID=39947 RepID=Q69WW7_ORYSJ|nr:unknown protein [Oryza sativa Japonica Group]BAD35915.1 unknown protein [Oryza sativa Japonica Group]BAF19992.1 Os06g0614400 [Oryza sativa Japonica Group]BAG99990.1 unnamed protein product [Oryza sativa Japonica Group]|eukprot:NP_001058078.1 Os06g0614400 [Oryza sativa Japonica Group]
MGDAAAAWTATSAWMGRRRRWWRLPLSPSPLLDLAGGGGATTTWMATTAWMGRQRLPGRRRRCGRGSPPLPLLDPAPTRRGEGGGGGGNLPPS